MSYKRAVNNRDKEKLYAKSGNMCALCRKQLFSENGTKLGEICHIEAVGEDGLRYNPKLTEEYINSYDNLILLCPTCHTLIDSKVNEATYTVATLQNIKKNHETYVSTFFSSGINVKAPIDWRVFEVHTLVQIVAEVYDKEINEDFVYETLDKVFFMTDLSRSAIYAITILCSGKKVDTPIDIYGLQGALQMGDESFGLLAVTLQDLEAHKFVKETKYIRPLDGYEDEFGYYHFVQSDYLYKTAQGEWYLKKRGLLFCALLQILGKTEFYEFMINQKIELLYKCGVCNFAR